MTIPLEPGFSIGDQAFLSDGRSGTITAIQFNGDLGVWEYLLDPIFEFFLEPDLSLTAPPEVEEAPARELPPLPDDLFGGPGQGVFIRREELRELVLSIMRFAPGVAVTPDDLEAGLVRVQNDANLTAQANLTLHVSQVEDKARDTELFIAAQFSELESAVTTTLSENEKRSTALETAAEESGGIGFLGFVGGLGGLLKDPVNWIMSRLGDHISSEVNDGLNR